MSEDKLRTVRFTLNEILSEPPSPPTYFDDEPAPATASSPALARAVERALPPTDAGIAALSAKEAKSLLADLGIDTAIRLRWAMRDIRGKRTKWSPVSENDLAALLDLGFIEARRDTKAYRPGCRCARLSPEFGCEDVRFCSRSGDASVVSSDLELIQDLRRWKQSPLFFAALQK
jgi:hypothetical protein